MPMPMPPAGGMPTFSGPHEIVVHLRHRVFFRQAGELRAEQVFLQPRVVQFGVGVRHFHAVDEQLEPLGDRRVAAASAWSAGTSRRDSR